MKADHKTLSIVTVTYQDPKGLDLTLSSLKSLLQSSLKWEHVLVDSSPEVTKASLKDLDPKWPLVHVQEPPRGIYSAMNTGIESSNGKYLWFLNGGDRLKDLGVLRKIIYKFENRSDLDLVVASANLFRDGEFLYSNVPHKNLALAILGTNKICHQGVLYRRSLFDKVGRFSTHYKLAGDYDHHFKCFVKGVGFDRVKDRLVNYKVEGSSSNWKLAWKEFQEITNSNLKDLPFKLRVLFKAMLAVEQVRLGVVKGMGGSALSSMIWPIWIWWNRKKAK